ncbi:MAG TPA: glycosyltransferase family 2 protein [Acidocella sp.]|nr:glycosyltransferase family 2 protein [Acidocella sp.]
MSDSTYVILINWNGAEDTLSCLEALARLAEPKPLVVVVDNGSTDGSLELLKASTRIDRLIASPRNLGFGPACNLAIAEISSEQPNYIWLLNNDARPDKNALRAMLEVAAADPKIGAIGSLIYRDLPMTDLECWGGGRVNLYSGQPHHLTAPGKLDYITGASVLLRASAMQQVGGFDEHFFLYWEDADLSLRLQRAGWLLAVAENSKIFHAASTSAKKAGTNIIRYFNDGAIRFYTRYAPFPALPIIINFLYRFFGQLKVGKFQNAWVLLKLYCAALGAPNRGLGRKS